MRQGRSGSRTKTQTRMGGQTVRGTGLCTAINTPAIERLPASRAGTLGPSRLGGRSSRALADGYGVEECDAVQVPQLRPVELPLDVFCVWSEQPGQQRPLGSGVLP